jgi:hypothetical protein
MESEMKNENNMACLKLNCIRQIVAAGFCALLLAPTLAVADSYDVKIAAAEKAYKEAKSELDAKMAAPRSLANGVAISEAGAKEAAALLALVLARKAKDDAKIAAARAATDAARRAKFGPEMAAKMAAADAARRLKFDMEAAEASAALFAGTDAEAAKQRRSDEIRAMQIEMDDMAAEAEAQRWNASNEAFMREQHQKQEDSAADARIRELEQQNEQTRIDLEYQKERADREAE